MKREILYILTYLFFLIFFVTSVFAQADVCVAESAPLFTATNKIYLNEPLNSVRWVITKNELPNILSDNIFAPLDVPYAQTIIIGANPRVLFAKEPKSSDDPSFILYSEPLICLDGGICGPLSVYDTMISFDKRIDFNSPNSKEKEINLFSKRFVVSPRTNNLDLELLREGNIIELSNINPTMRISISQKQYTIELVSASDNSVNIKIEDNNGKTDVEEIAEGTSKIVNGLIVLIVSADETNSQISSRIIVADQIFTLRQGQPIAVGIGEEGRVKIPNPAEDYKNGMWAIFYCGNLNPCEEGDTQISGLEINVAFPDLDHDAILPGNAFVDPIFGTFKVDFAKLNIPEESEERDSIRILTRNDRDDVLSANFKDVRGYERVFQWAKAINKDTINLAGDLDGKKIVIFENEILHRNEYVVVGNEDEGRLLKVSQITNQQTGFSSDKVKFTDVFSGDTYEATIISEGVGTVTFAGRAYDIRYSGTSSDENNWVRINYPDSQGTGEAIIYPTIETFKGAKIALYTPLRINLVDWDGKGNSLQTIKIPNGEGYADVSTSATEVNVGKLTFKLGREGNNLLIHLRDAEGNTIDNPALIVFEEADFRGENNAFIVTLEPGNTASDGIGVDKIIRTWSDDSEWDSIIHASDSRLVSEADVYGTIGIIDSTDSDQKNAFISYPNEQVYALIYVSSNMCQESNAFIRGNANGDGRVDLTDAVYILNFLFLDGPAPRCLDAADVDDSGRVLITDAVYLLNHLFLGGPPPPAPYPSEGVDPTQDGLSCG